MFIVNLWRKIPRAMPASILMPQKRGLWKKSSCHLWAPLFLQHLFLICFLVVDLGYSLGTGTMFPDKYVTWTFVLRIGVRENYKRYIHLICQYKGCIKDCRCMKKWTYSIRTWRRTLILGCFFFEYRKLILGIYSLFHSYFARVIRKWKSVWPLLLYTLNGKVSTKPGTMIEFQPNCKLSDLPPDLKLTSICNNTIRPSKVTYVSTIVTLGEIFR